VVERLRALLERPLDPAVARAVLVLACSLTVGFAALGVTGSDRAAAPRQRQPAAGRPAGAAPSGSEPARAPLPERPGAHPTDPRQDPQDRPGSAAERRARHELMSHRALQHVPYRRGDVAITLVGARGPRAVLRVQARTATAAHRGWRAFLRRYHDLGRTYLPIFRSKGGSRG
jgi:hypothetical protein